MHNTHTHIFISNTKLQEHHPPPTHPQLPGIMNDEGSDLAKVDMTEYRRQKTARMCEHSNQILRWTNSHNEPIDKEESKSSSIMSLSREEDSGPSTRCLNSNNDNENDRAPTDEPHHGTITTAMVSRVDIQRQSNEPTAVVNPQNVELSADEEEPITLTATVVEDEADLERRVRERILKEAVEAEVMELSETSIDLEDDHDEENRNNKTVVARKRCPKFPWIVLLLLLLAATVVGTVVGLVVANSLKSSKPKKLRPPPRPRPRPEGQRSNSSTSGGGNKNKDN